MIPPRSNAQTDMIGNHMSKHTLAATRAQQVLVAQALGFVVGVASFDDFAPEPLGLAGCRGAEVGVERGARFKPQMALSFETTASSGSSGSTRTGCSQSSQRSGRSVQAAEAVGACAGRGGG